MSNAQTPETITIGELRAAHATGGVSAVSVVGDAGAFLVKIEGANGRTVYLSKARDPQPRRFMSFTAALSTLLSAGISQGKFDATNWDPDLRIKEPGNRGRSQALREAHAAAAALRAKRRPARTHV